MEPCLFAFLTVIAITELSLTAYLVNRYDTIGWPGWRYRSLIIFLLFDACWTVFFGFAYICFLAADVLNRLARLTASLVWLLVTAILWGTAAGLFTAPRWGRVGGICWSAPALDLCRQTQTAEALAWTAFALCIITMIVSCITWHYTRPPPVTHKEGQPV